MYAFYACALDFACIKGIKVSMALTSHERVRHWRELRGLSQSELGGLCGFPQHKISRIETGATDASADDIEAIARGLGLSMAEFYGGAVEAHAS